jgi:hypothetical protein
MLPNLVVGVLPGVDFNTDLIRQCLEADALQVDGQVVRRIRLQLFQVVGYLLEKILVYHVYSSCPVKKVN